MPLLLWLIIVPFVAALVAFFLPKLPSRHFKIIAFAISLIHLATLLIGQHQWLDSTLNWKWLSPLNINFHLGVDSLSLFFLYLAGLVVPISLLAVRQKDMHHPHVFFGLIFLLQGLLVLFFTAKDLAIFTVFWEAMLIPLYFIIAFWGGPERRAAALKFLIYMIAGSALMVAGVLALYFAASGTFDMDTLAPIASQAPYAHWIAFVFLLAFAVKTPLFPFHAWLPDTYCQAPTTGTIILAGVLSKAGIYGILRIGTGFFAPILQEWSPILIGLAIAGVFYGGLAAWRQTDYKRLIAYSSFSHVNFILAGLFIWNVEAQSGAILQSLNHALTISALFLVASWLEKRLGTTQMSPFSGLATIFPRLCWVTLVFVLASVALPGTNNFVGEFLIFFGMFVKNYWLAALLGCSVILSVIYMLRWMQEMYFSTPRVPHGTIGDIKAKELLIALPLIALILWIGFYPSPALDLLKPAAEQAARSVGNQPSTQTAALALNQESL